MKTKITLLIGAVALITLSFTFTTVDISKSKVQDSAQNSNELTSPVGGIVVDEVVQ